MKSIRYLALVGLVALISWIGVRQHRQPHAIAKEAMKQGVTIGPWKQIATLESYYEMSILSCVGTQPDTIGFENVTGFVDDHRFAIADGKHPIRIFDVENGRLQSSFGHPEKRGGFGRRFIASPDGRFLLLVPDASPVVWDTRTQTSIGMLPVFKNGYTAAAFLADGHTLVTYRANATENLQVWDIDLTSGKFMLRKAIDADRDACGLKLIGPYVVLQGFRRSQVFDASTFEIALQQRADTDEQFLYIDPPESNQVGTYVSLQFSAGGHRPWNQQTPVFRMRALPGGRDMRQWECPIEEKGQNDSRYASLYAVSPQRTTLAISQQGRVNFLRIQDGSRIQSFPDVKEARAAVQFADEDHAFVMKEEADNPIQLVEISTGKVLAKISELDAKPEISPDGHSLLARRRWVPVPDKSGMMQSVNPEQIIFWREGTP